MDAVIGIVYFFVYTLIVYIFSESKKIEIFLKKLVVISIDIYRSQTRLESLLINRRFLMEQIIETPVQVSSKQTIDQSETNKGGFYKSAIANQLAKQLVAPIKLVQTSSDLYDVRELWKQTYKELFPDIKGFHCDPFDFQSRILYTKNAQNKTVSSARLVIDSPLGLPEDSHFPPEVNEYRACGMKLMEYGRFIIEEGNPSLLKAYYKAVYQVAIAENVDVIMMAMKPNHVAFHCRLIGAILLTDDMKLYYGGENKLAALAWEVKNTKERFFKWAKIKNKATGDL